MQIETPPTDKPYEKPEGERRGLVIVNTGDGKGKSTAAFGLALRARDRPKEVHVVITGRRCPPEIIEIADTVTEMTKVKHAFNAGIPAQRGIED